jgi:hypothetical protein
MIGMLASSIGINLQMNHALAMPSKKIWFDSQHEGLHFISYDVASQKKRRLLWPGTQNVSIAQLCVSAVEGAILGFKGHSLRFVGFDLGAQLAAACAAKLYDSRAAVAPTRLTMLDPIFTEHHLKFFRCHHLDFSSGVGDFAAERTAEAVEGLWMRGIPTEVFKSSPLSENAHLNNPNRLLSELALEVVYDPTWCDAVHPKILRFERNWECKHKAAQLMYFSGKGDSPPLLIGAGVSEGRYAMPGACLTPAAACSDEETTGLARTQEKARTVKQRDVSWKQVEGQSTAQTQDDKYELQTAFVSPFDAQSIPTAPPKESVPPYVPIPQSLLRGIGNDNGSNAIPSESNADEDMPSAPGIAAFRLQDRLYAMPARTRFSVAVLSILGIAMVCYGVQPLFGIWFGGARELKWGRLNSFDDESSDESDESD